MRFLSSRFLKGISIIEVLLLVFILSVIVLSFYSALSTGTYTALNASRRLSAVSVAKEKMEQYRNMPYADLGNINGSPAGNIPQEEYAAMPNGRFHIFTSISYVDDDFDGSGAGDANGVITDYKNVQVTVKWAGESNTETVSLSSYFVPIGIESLVANSGVLIVNVKDSSDQPISHAKLRITDPDAYHPYSKIYENNPTIQTDSDGQFIDLAAWEDGQPRYKIEAYKDGYKPVTTYAPYPTSSFFPVDSHVSILQGQVTQKDIVMERSSSVVIKSIEPNGEQVSSVQFHMTGGRTLGTLPLGTKKYDYDEDVVTNGTSELSIADLSWGKYSMYLRGTTDTNYVLYRLDQISYPDPNAFSLGPGENRTVNMLLAPKSKPSLLVSFVDQNSGTAIEGMNVRLSASTETFSFDASSVTDEFGKVYFSTDKDMPLESAEYTLEASGESIGYGEFDEQVEVNASLVEKNITMTEL